MTIKNVRTQVVAGVLYKFALDMQVGSMVKTCDVSVLEQAWTNTIKFTEAPKCSSQPLTRSIVGNEVATEVTKKVQEIANWVATSMSTNELHNVLSVKNVRTQLVAGLLYKFTVDMHVGNSIKTCQVSVLEQAWLNSIKFTEEPKCTSTLLNVRPRGETVGQFVDVPVTKEITDLVNWAVSSLKTETEKHTLTQLKSVQAQVVAGMLYKIVFTSNVLIQASPISFAIRFETRECEMTVFTQSWTGLKQVTASSCKVTHQ